MTDSVIEYGSISLISGYKPVNCHKLVGPLVWETYTSSLDCNTAPQRSPNKY